MHRSQVYLRQLLLSKPEAKSASKPIALKMTMMPMIYQNQLFRKNNPKSTEQHESLEATGIEDHESFVEPWYL